MRWGVGEARERPEGEAFSSPGPYEFSGTWCLPFRVLLVGVSWDCVSWAPLMMPEGLVKSSMDLEGLLGVFKPYDCLGQAL